jgi:capsid protein
MYPIMMDEEHTKEIRQSIRVMRSRRPNQYMINSKKREVAK